MKHIFLYVGMVVSMFLSFLSAAATEFETDGLEYQIINSNTVKFLRDNSNKLSLYIPETVTCENQQYTVVEMSSYGNSECQELFIPRSVTKVDVNEHGVYGGYLYTYGYFDGWSNLQAITVAKDNPAFSSIDGVLFDKDMNALLRYPRQKENIRYEIPYGVTEIFDRACEDNENLKSVSIPNTVRKISKSAFAYCSNLGDVKMSSQIEMIFTDAFEDTSIKSIVLPPTLNYIGDDAFDNHNNGPYVEEVYCLSINPPSILRYKGKENPFNEITLNQGVLYVPNGCEKAYRYAECWQQFKNIREIDVSGIDNVHAESLNQDRVQKIIRDGRIIICKDGVDYDVIGNNFNFLTW